MNTHPFGLEAVTGIIRNVCCDIGMGLCAIGKGLFVFFAYLGYPIVAAAILFMVVFGVPKPCCTIIDTRDFCVKMFLYNGDYEWQLHFKFPETSQLTFLENGKRLLLSEKMRDTDRQFLENRDWFQRHGVLAEFDDDGRLSGVILKTSRTLGLPEKRYAFIYDGLSMEMPLDRHAFCALVSNKKIISYSHEEYL